jgi:hypothetical protein
MDFCPRCSRKGRGGFRKVSDMTDEYSEHCLVCGEWSAWWSLRASK